jgi:predicted O-methyltransferase YrrM
VTDRRLQITDQIHRYLVDHSVREPDVLARLRDATASLPQAQMQIGLLPVGDGLTLARKR